MKKLLMGTIITGAILLTSLTASAVPPQPYGNFPPPPGHNYHKKLTPEQKAQMEKRRAEIDKRLGLTEEQKAQLKAIHEKSKVQIAPKVKLLTNDEYELEVLERKQFNEEHFNIETLENVKLTGRSQDELRAEIKKLRAEIHEIKKANFAETQSIFTEKQKKELEKMRKEREKKMKNKHGNHRHP